MYTWKYIDCFTADRDFFLGIMQASHSAFSLNNMAYIIKWWERKLFSKTRMGCWLRGPPILWQSCRVEDNILLKLSHFSFHCAGIHL